MYSHEGPVLDVCWNKEGNKLFSGGADKAVRMYDVATGQPTQVGAHDGAVKCVKWIDAPTGGILATGSWDKTVKVELSTLQPELNLIELRILSTGIFEHPTPCRVCR